MNHSDLDLEGRLEVNKRLGNASLEYLERWYDRRKVVERYANGDIELHVHLLCALGRVCANYRSVDQRPSHRGEVAVLVWIREPPEPRRPLASSVRLQVLDHPDMACVQADEVGALPVHSRDEALWRIFDRELRALLDLSGVEPGQGKDEIVKGSTKVVDRLADENEKHRRERLQCLEAFLVSLQIELSEIQVTMRRDIVGDPAIKIANVFFRPSYPEEGILKGLLRNRDHAAG